MPQPRLPVVQAPGCSRGERETPSALGAGLAAARADAT